MLRISGHRDAAGYDFLLIERSSYCVLDDDEDVIERFGIEPLMRGFTGTGVDAQGGRQRRDVIFAHLDDPRAGLMALPRERICMGQTGDEATSRLPRTLE